MRLYWANDFLTLRTPDWSDHAILAINRVLVAPFWFGHFDAPRRPAALALGLMVAGLVVIWHSPRGRPAALLLGVPYVMLVSAALAGRYPLAERLGLFAIPLFLLAAGAAVVAVLERAVPSQRVRDFALVLIVTLVVFIEYPDRVELESNFGYEPTRQLVHDFERTSSNEPVYVFARGVPAWIFYSTDWGAPDLARLRWYADVAAATGPAFENAPTRARAMRDEGDSLRYEYASRQEIIGLGSGEQFGVHGGTRVPDSGWARNEARRFRAAARPFGWLFASHYFVYGSTQPLDDTELGPLLDEIRKQGGLLVCATVRPNAALYRFRFSGPDVPALPTTAPQYSPQTLILNKSEAPLVPTAIPSCA